jgi:RNA-dependent RNA polymerase
MIRNNIDVRKDVFLIEILNNLKQKAFHLLRKKTNILVRKSARLLGILDEYNILEPD